MSLLDGGYVMRHIDFTPLYRSTIGFDRLFDLVGESAGLNTDTGYPPYNIERTGDDTYRITMAIAGFGKDDLTLEVKESLLTVKAEKTATTNSDEREYLHRGIAERSFERRFQLADYVEVSGADVQDGLLHVDLVRRVPERLKPRTIEIGGGDTGGATTKQIEAHNAA